MPAPTRTLDALTSATLKHVRDDWWDEAFTTFLVERLRPRVGNRILDVGCGTGRHAGHTALEAQITALSAVSWGRSLRFPKSPR